MDMNENNIILIEKHDKVTNEAIKTDDGKHLFIHGFKIYRAIVLDPNEKEGYRVIAQYDHNNDATDLSELKNYTGRYMVSVDRDSYNNDLFVWNTCILEDGADDNSVFAIKNNRQCTPEEVDFLNSLFPEYYKNAF
jgi:hypothetical protein